MPQRASTSELRRARRGAESRIGVDEASIARTLGLGMSKSRPPRQRAQGGNQGENSPAPALEPGLSTSDYPRRRRRKLVAGAVAGGLGVLLIAQFLAFLEPAAAREVRAACNGLRPEVANSELGEIPTQARDFSAQTPEGDPISLSDYRGEVVLLNFWASWCEVCESEKPHLEALQEDFRSDGLRVVSVASDPSWDRVRDALGGPPRESTPVDVLLDPPEAGDNLGRIARAYGVGAVPESFLIDREGNVRQYFVNRRTWDSSVAKTCMRAFLDE